MGACTSTPRENEYNTSSQDVSKGVILPNANKLAVSPCDIFFTNLMFRNQQKLHSFIDAYCRQILSSYNHNVNQIPTAIISLLVHFYERQKNEAPPFPRYVRWQNNEIMYIDDNNEHIYHQLCLWETDFIRKSNDINIDTLKITICNDLVLKTGSKIIGTNNGNIILNVEGHLDIGNNAKIICPNGNIFIKAKSLTLRSFANIRTFNKFKYKPLNRTNCSTLYGNIYMEIEQNIIIGNDAQIKSGDIDIKFGGDMRSDDDIDIVMIAVRNELTINSKKFRIKQSYKAEQNKLAKGK